MMAKLVSKINTTKLRINRKAKQKNQLLWDLQCKQQELYQELEDILSGKKGIVRQLLGGRYQFTSRDVIVPDKTLRLDEVSLPYVALVELLQQTIINLLRKIYNLSANDAYNIWYLAQSEPDDRVVSIIENLLKKRKVHILINRNPTISYGSILQMTVVKMTMSFVMKINTNITPLIEGDYDGDTLNVVYITNKAFYEACAMVFNPRNSMQISRNDGKFNGEVLFSKDSMINANSIVYLSRKKYTKEQLDIIKKAKEMD